MSNELGTSKILVCPGDRHKLANQKSDFTVTSQSGSEFIGYQYNTPNGDNTFVNAGDYTSYSAGNVKAGKDNATSYTVGLAADELQPNSILSADRNWSTGTAPGQDKNTRGVLGGNNGRPFMATTIGSLPTGLAVWVTGTTQGTLAAQHDQAGNFSLSDGSVQQTSSAGLQLQLRQEISGLGGGNIHHLFPN